MPESAFLSINAIAERLDVSRWTVQRMLDDGEIPSVPVRGTRRVDPADFAAWIAAAKSASRKSPEKPEALKRPIGRPRKPAVAKSRKQANAEPATTVAGTL